MSLDDQIGDVPDGDPVEVCDGCHERLQAEGPTPIGWRICAFECLRCKKTFCQHLDAGGSVCGPCTARATTRRRKIGDGSAHWPRVPDDGTAQEVDAEISPPGQGWRIALMIAALVLLFAGMAGVVLMFAHHGGGGR